MALKLKSFENCFVCQQLMLMGFPYLSYLYKGHVLHNISTCYIPDKPYIGLSWNLPSCFILCTSRTQQCVLMQPWQGLWFPLQAFMLKMSTHTTPQCTLDKAVHHMWRCVKLMGEKIVNMQCVWSVHVCGQCMCVHVQVSPIRVMKWQETPGLCTVQLSRSHYILLPKGPFSSSC